MLNIMHLEDHIIKKPTTVRQLQFCTHPI